MRMLLWLAVCAANPFIMVVVLITTPKLYSEMFFTGVLASCLSSLLLFVIFWDKIATEKHLDKVYDIRRYNKWLLGLTVKQHPEAVMAGLRSETKKLLALFVDERALQDKFNQTLIDDINHEDLVEIRRRIAAKKADLKMLVEAATDAGLQLSENWTYADLLAEPNMLNQAIT
ncbi:MAG: hypothetical protein RLZZ70_784 [Candidatus Parcubacteria bacterium]